MPTLHPWNCILKHLLQFIENRNILGLNAQVLTVLHYVRLCFHVVMCGSSLIVTNLCIYLHCALVSALWETESREDIDTFYGYLYVYNLLWGLTHPTCRWKNPIIYFPQVGKVQKSSVYSDQVCWPEEIYRVGMKDCWGSPDQVWRPCNKEFSVGDGHLSPKESKFTLPLNSCCSGVLSIGPNGEGGFSLMSPPTQLLISSRNSLTDGPRQNISLAMWGAPSALRLTLKIKHPLGDRNTEHTTTHYIVPAANGGVDGHRLIFK